MTKPNPYLIDELTEQQVRLLQSAGFPTFDEFQKNPHKYKDSNESVLELIERGPEVLRDATAGKHVLSVVGKRVKNLEEMQRTAKDMGFNLERMTFEVNLENVGKGKYIHHVNLVPKKEFQAGDEKT